MISKRRAICDCPLKHSGTIIESDVQRHIVTALGVTFPENRDDLPLPNGGTMVACMFCASNQTGAK
jgi:hypothetical protein